MSAMTNVTVIIPGESTEALKSYYKDVLLFREEDYMLYPPLDHPQVSLQLMVVDEESQRESPPKKNFVILSYGLEKNLLAYCEKIHDNGALIDSLGVDKYGFYVHISDPAGNKFEITCSNLAEINDQLGKNIFETLTRHSRKKILQTTQEFALHDQPDATRFPLAKIIIPGECYERLKAYYRDVLGFVEHHEGVFELPNRNRTIGLLLTTLKKEEKSLIRPQKHYMSFSFLIEKSFLSFCIRLYKNGAIFDLACRTPGGYYARLCDPAGNQFEIWCESDEDENPSDPGDLPMFYSY